MDIRSKLKLIQQLSNLSQENLAKEFGVSFATLNSWINGRSIPHAKNVKKIDELFAKYSGIKIIPEDVLNFKKQLIIKKSKQYKSIFSFLLGRKDLFDEIVLSLTFNTNKIEGSTLTEKETAALLFDNTSLKNKNFIEQLEAKNHQTAFYFLFDWLREGKEINRDLILRLHAILMNSIMNDAGLYRRHPVRILGTNIITANHLKISHLMNELIKDINKNSDIVLNVSEVHAKFEQIHPFSDGNGRIGRLLIQAMLLKNNIVPALILKDDKQVYMNYLNKAQTEGDLMLLQNFICDAILRGFDLIKK